AVSVLDSATRRGPPAGGDPPLEARRRRQAGSLAKPHGHRRQLGGDLAAVLAPESHVLACHQARIKLHLRPEDVEGLEITARELRPPLAIDLERFAVQK